MKNDAFVSNPSIYSNHILSSCVMFTMCKACDTMIEVQRLKQHALKVCKFKAMYAECDRCGDSVFKDEYSIHVQRGDCSNEKKSTKNRRQMSALPRES